MNGMFIDTSLCVGCRGCMTACKSWNELPGEKTTFTGSLQSMPDTTPKTYTLIKFYEREENGRIRFDFFKQQCFHCGDAACEKACPEDAIYHTKEGAVVRDYDRCIGCDYCQRACPFNIPRIDTQNKKMHKCTLCFDRLENGEIPACALTCSPGAIKYGNRDELWEAAQKRLAEVKKEYPKANLYPSDKNALGGTGVFYLLINEPEFYGLPAEAKLKTTFSLWHDVVRPLGKIVPGIALGATVIAAVANSVKKQREEGHGE
ncbi:4Fe-4S dicluster domain-containing protein [Carboxydothermus hydrogenoformans]|uniref:Formate dehydrogenase-O, iron-sulfur subunit n=1 Tax=Carboxydothermus hydrogenoformans (strain ATCC BAA-161 / DSM 6008 / Z-2901) TaxID=246194 RepID=Q3ADY6_CARHZ|nr:4Fe-4S dicluster domain-containing protein [Carboxydothermus hydrogenoformans]ABB15410.1 formate dehydrogenase-O, iron-sulfur subunit [Carboxydothermus hydrogenoformans Z-2901]